MNLNISNPNVYLFIYSLHKDAQENHSLWQKGSEILLNWEKKLHHFNTNLEKDQKFDNTNIRSLLDFKEKSSNFREDLIKIRNPEGKVDRLDFQGELDHLLITGYLYPLQIYDSYALYFNVGYPDNDGDKKVEVNCDFLQQFKLTKLSELNADENFLGKTLLITAWLPEEAINKNTRSLANECCKELLDTESASLFHHAGELFGSPIFEYGLIHRENNTCPHVIVWLFKDKESDSKFDKYEQEIIDLFFYRHKLIRAFQDSYKIGQELEEQQNKIQDDLEHFELKTNNKDLTEDELNAFQNRLKEITIEALGYTRNLNLLQKIHNIIVVNTHNYNEKLEQIHSGEFEKNISFLETFGQKNCSTFIEQIKGDLNYFVPNANLFDKTIAAIRGLVEIEQVRLEKKKLDSEKDKLQREEDRTTKVQNTIEAVGVGIGVGFGVGGLFSANYYLVEHPWQLPSSKQPLLPPHPFFAAFSYSLVLGVGLGLLSWWCTKRYLDKKRSQKLPSKTQRSFGQECSNLDEGGEGF